MNILLTYAQYAANYPSLRLSSDTPTFAVSGYCFSTEFRLNN
jgi:hypothetical protein